MTYIDVDKADLADVVYMQGKALINDSQVKALSKAVHGYFLSVLRYTAFDFILQHHKHTLKDVYSPVQRVCACVSQSVLTFPKLIVNTF